MHDFSTAPEMRRWSSAKSTTITLSAALFLYFQSKAHWNIASKPCGLKTGPAMGGHCLTGWTTWYVTDRQGAIGTDVNEDLPSEPNISVPDCAWTSNHGVCKIPTQVCFPDSTLRSNGELGDNNQVQVALVIHLFWLGNN